MTKPNDLQATPIMDAAKEWRSRIKNKLDWQWYADHLFEQGRIFEKQLAKKTAEVEAVTREYAEYVKIGVIEDEITQARLRGERHPKDNGFRIDGEIDVAALLQKNAQLKQKYEQRGLYLQDCEAANAQLKQEIARINDLIKINVAARGKEFDRAESLKKEVERLTRMVRIAEAKNQNSLANNLCPDHRDKQQGKPCLACEIERLRKVTAGILMAAVNAPTPKAEA